MKKQMMTLAAVLMAGAAVTSCSSDNEMDSPKAPAAKTYTMTVSATKGGDETRALSLSGEGDKTLNATWATTEKVYVKKGDTWAIGTLQPQEAGATATLKGSLTDITPAANDVLTLQFPRSGERDYSGQVGTLADIAAKYDYATATVTVKSVSGGDIIPVATTTTFTNQQAIVKFTLKNGDDALSATKLVVNVGGTEYEVNPVSATSEIYVAIPGFSGQTVTLTATVSSDTYTYEKTNVTFENGKYYRVTAKMAKQAAGAISGKFSVSANKQVYFSKGNLQYDGTNWKFADNQYDYVGDGTNGNVSGSNNASISETYEGWIDLFGWGTSGKTISNYGSAYQPWATSTTQTDYGPSGNYNLIGTYANGDWGVNMGEGWRTLSKDEWVYLFNTRTVNNGTGSGKSYTLGQKVNDVLGVVLYPDDYTGAEYSGSDWATYESAGCVFLPAAGSRDGTSVYNVGSYGDYWSSTASGTDGAYRVYFYSGNVDPADDDDRSGGFSVRLVRPVE